MADPLSIAASVAGLLTTAGKICSVLSDLVGAVSDAPQSARAALGAVEEVRSALEMVQGLLDTVSGLPSKRKMLVRLDYIRLTFANCVLTLSELESLVCVAGVGDGGPRESGEADCDRRADPPARRRVRSAGARLGPSVDSGKPLATVLRRRVNGSQTGRCLGVWLVLSTAKTLVDATSFAGKEPPGIRGDSR
jgi:hypothetical protein